MTWQTEFHDAQMEMFGIAVKATQCAPQRWTGVVVPVRKIITKWSAVGQAFTMAADSQHMPMWVRLKPQHTALMEVLSMLEALTGVIEEAQDVTYPTGAHSLARYIGIRTKEFDITKPLSVRVYGEDGSFVGVEERPHGELTAVAQKTRALIAKTMDDKYFHMRYGPGAWGQSNRVRPHYIHDIALMMHPNFARFRHIDVMVQALGGTAGKSRPTWCPLLVWMVEGLRP